MQLACVQAWLLLISLFALTRCQDQTSYTDAIGQQVWTLAYWTVSTTPAVCVPKYNSGWSVLSVVTATGSDIFGTAYAAVSVSETLKIVHVHFRGPDSIMTFITTGFQDLIAANYPVQMFEGMNVYQGFATTFTNLWQGGLRTAMNSAWEEYCDFPIYITGHSVGGCIAHMLAVKLKLLGMWTYSNINLYTFSASRCGYQPFAIAVNNAAIVRYTIRYSDYVIQLPATTCTSLDTSNPKDCFWHAGYGIQYSKSLFGVTSLTSRCATAETSTCLAGSILNVGNQIGFYSLNYGLTPPTC